MANLKSSKKDIRRITKRTEHNRKVKSRLKTMAKCVLSLVKEGSDANKVREAAREYVSALDNAAKSNIIHMNKAIRHKQAMSKYIFLGAS